MQFLSPPPLSLNYFSLFLHCFYTIATFDNDGSRILCTKLNQAKLFDVSRLSTIREFIPDQSELNYHNNFAVFNPTNELILCDGTLYDTRTARVVYKFDNLSNGLAGSSGLFHPCALEVVIGSAVWDVRTLKMIKNCPSLDQCHVSYLLVPNF